MQSTSLVLDLCTGPDADPFPARRCPRILLSPAMSADHASGILPPRAPAIITTRRVPRAPCVTRRELEPGVVIDAAANDDVPETPMLVAGAD